MGDRGRSTAWACGLSWVAALVLLPAALAGSTSAVAPQQGGTLRVTLRSADVDSLDPALAYQGPAWMLIDTTCAPLLAYGGGKRPRLYPEVAREFPRVSRDGRTYTFRLRPGFRFSDGSEVRANAFSHAINRTLSLSQRSPWAPYFADVIGGRQVIAGKREAASGLVARGRTLVVRLTRPVPDFPARMASVCAVPPTLPADPEGAAVFPAAGPYHVAEYRPGERVVINRNRYYGGRRTHHVDGFAVDLRATSPGQVVDLIDRGEADWGWAPPPTYFDPTRRLVAKYGINRSRFFVTPGFEFRGFVLNTARPLFRDNPSLRRAVNFAIHRAALRRALGGPHAMKLTDQYLPPSMPGYRDGQVYPLERPDLRRAQALADGNTRSGIAVLYTIDRPDMLAAAQRVRRDLRRIGLEVRITGVPLEAYFGRLGATGPYDIGFQPWIPDFLDPYSVLNVLFDGDFVGRTNWSRLDSPEVNRLLRATSGLQGPRRYRAYGRLDLRIAREESPLVAIGYLNDATLVSARVSCVEAGFDLTAVCIE